MGPCVIHSPAGIQQPPRARGRPSYLPFLLGLSAVVLWLSSLGSGFVKSNGIFSQFKTLECAFFLLFFLNCPVEPPAGWVGSRWELTGAWLRGEAAAGAGGQTHEVGQP